MVAPTRSQIKIKALQRLTREHELYLKEEIEIMARLKSLKENNGDEYEIKKIQQVLDETRRVVPNVRKRLESETEETKKLQVADEDKAELEEAVAKAEAYLAAH